MDRRSFLTAVATASATIGFASDASAGNEDVGAGCEGAVLALNGWINALAKRDFDFLEQHLAPDFVFTTAPMKTASGTIINVQKDKKAFIEQDRHVYNSNIQFLGVTARRLGELVITIVFAQISEEFRGDLGPQLPTAAEMNAFAKGKKLGYASGWKEIDGRWQCTSHHVLGEVNHA